MVAGGNRGFGLSAIEAMTELPFSQPVPKTLGAVSITLWSLVRGGLPLHRNLIVPEPQGFQTETLPPMPLR